MAKNENSEVQTLKTIASELVEENAHLKNDLDDKERELEGLYAIIKNTAYLMDWQDIQGLIIKLIHDILPTVRFCLIAVWREGEDMLRVRFKRTGDETAVLDHIRLPLRFDETTRWDEAVSTTEWGDYFQGLGIGDLKYTFVGLTAKEKQLGFLMIGKPHHGESFAGEWRFLNAVAHHFAVTLDNAMLYQLATTDSLTGLFNRRYFDNQLERGLLKAERRDTPLSVLMMDIDRFKEVNDLFGHPAGDQVLIELARRLKSAFRNEATRCRYGGEEFAVMIPEADIFDAKARAEEFRRSIASNPFEFTSEGQRITKTITISIGVACFPVDGTHPRQLVDHSDQALYHAKQAGRNRVVSTAEIKDAGPA